MTHCWGYCLDVPSEWRALFASLACCFACVLTSFSESMFVYQLMDQGFQWSFHVTPSLLVWARKLAYLALLWLLVSWLEWRTGHYPEMLVIVEESWLEFVVERALVRLEVLVEEYEVMLVEWQGNWLPGVGMSTLRCMCTGHTLGMDHQWAPDFFLEVERFQKFSSVVHPLRLFNTFDG